MAERTVCSCGAQIEEVIKSSLSPGKFWQRVGTCEVCIDNHWHEPAAARVEDNAPTRVESIRCRHCGHIREGHMVFDRCIGGLTQWEPAAQPANTVAESEIDREYMMDDRNFPAANTDDRTADTIPDEGPAEKRVGEVFVAVERRDLTPLGNMMLVAQSLSESLVSAETRIAVLEAALREAREFVNSHSEKWYASGQGLLKKIGAALAAPSGEKEKV